MKWLRGEGLARGVILAEVEDILGVEDLIGLGLMR